MIPENVASLSWDLRELDRAHQLVVDHGDYVDLAQGYVLARPAAV